MNKNIAIDDRIIDNKIDMNAVSKMKLGLLPCEKRQRYADMDVLLRIYLEKAEGTNGSKSGVADHLWEAYSRYMFYMPYDEYLKTMHWEFFRQKVLDYYKETCQLCGSQKNLNVHHKNYSFKGSETFDDVILLCNACHKKQYNIKG